MITVNLEYRHGILFIRLIGQLTKYNINKYNNIVINKIVNIGIRDVVLNLENITKIDPLGIKQLIYTYKLCHKNNGCVFICGINQNIKNTIKQSGLFNYITEIPNEKKADRIIDMRVK